MRESYNKSGCTKKWPNFYSIGILCGNGVVPLTIREFDLKLYSRGTCETRNFFFFSYAKLFEELGPDAPLFPGIYW